MRRATNILRKCLDQHPKEKVVDNYGWSTLLCICIYICIHMYIHVNVCIWKCVYIHTYMYLNMCVYIHTYIHTYMYMSTSPRLSVSLSLSRCTFLQKTSQHISLHPILFLDTTAGAGRLLLDGLDVALRDAVMRCEPFFMGKKWWVNTKKWGFPEQNHGFFTKSWRRLNPVIQTCVT